MTRFLASVRGRWLMLALVLLLGYVVLYPAAIVLSRSFEGVDGQAGPTLEHYRTVLSSRDFADMLWNTGKVVALGVSISMVLGASLAWLIERTDLPGKRLLAYAPMVPVFVSPLVMATGYVFLLDPAVGFVNVRLRDLLGSTDREGPINIYSAWSVGGVVGLYATSYVYPYVRAGLMSMDSALEEAGRVAGASMSKTLRTISFPLLRPALLAAALLSLIVSVAEYSIPSVLGNRVNLRIVSTEIVRYIRAFPADPAAGAALSMLVMLVTLLGLVPVHRALSQSHRYEVIGRGTHSITRLGRWRWPLFVGVMGFVVLTAVLPLAAITIVACMPFWTADIPWDGLTFENFRAVFIDDPRTWTAVKNSVWFSVVAATLAVVLAFAIGYFRRFRRGRLSSTIDLVGTLPLGIPSIVLGVGFLFLSLRGPIVLYGSAAALILAYLAKFTPLALRALGSSFAQVRGELMEAARVSGAGEARSVAGVLVPLSAPGIQAGWILMIIVMLREFPMSVLLFHHNTVVMSVHLFNLLGTGLYGPVAAFSLVLFGTGVLLTAAVVIVMAPLQRWTRRADR